MKTATANGKGKNGKGKAKFDFTPTEFDRDSMPPAFPAGEWTAKLLTAKVGQSKKKADGRGGYPMITLEFKITGTENEDDESWIGKKQRAWLVLPPKGVDGERMMKLNLRDFCQNFDIELDTLPTGRITKIGQFSDFIAAIKGIEGTIWTVLRDNNGEEQTSIQFKAPPAATTGKGKGGKVKDEEEEEEETDEEEDEEEDEEDETEDSDEDEEEEEDEDEEEEEEEERPVVRGKKPAKGNVTDIAAAPKRGPGRPRKNATA
jgi:hypothetical protein